jgi:hypothetical protein
VFNKVKLQSRLSRRIRRFISARRPFYVRVDMQTQSHKGSFRYERDQRIRASSSLTLCNGLMESYDLGI